MEIFARVLFPPQRDFDPGRRELGRKALRSIAMVALPTSLTGMTIGSIFAPKNAEAFVPLIIGGVYLSAELVAALSVSATITAGYGINKTYDIITNKQDNTYHLGINGQAFAPLTPNDMQIITSSGGFMPAPQFSPPPGYNQHHGNPNDNRYQGGQMHQNSPTDTANHNPQVQIPQTETLPIHQDAPIIMMAVNNEKYERWEV